MFRNFKMVSYVVFGRGCFNQLDDILSQKRQSEDDFSVFLVDDVFQDGSLTSRVPVRNRDKIIWVNVDDEPKTTYVDALAKQIKDLLAECRGLRWDRSGRSDAAVALNCLLLLSESAAAAPWILPRPYL